MFDCYEKLIFNLSRYNVIKLFVDASININIQNKIINTLNTQNKKVIIVSLTSSFNQSDADRLRYSGEEFVLVLGKVNVTSIAKYYAYANELEYAIIPAIEVCEYSFSKYAYLCDNYFCFYLCNMPIFVFVDSTFFSKQDVFNLAKVLTYKNIVKFEKEWNKNIFKTSGVALENLIISINKLEWNVKSVIKLYASIALMLNNHKTSEVLGNEYLVLSLLAKNNKNMVDNTIAAQNMLVKFYDCLHKFEIFYVQQNVNMHIKKLKDIFSIPFYSCMNAKTKYSKDEITSIRGKFKAYVQYHKNLLAECKTAFVYSKVEDFDKLLEGSLALCANITNADNILRFAKEFGYFENLIKSLS